MESSSIFRKKVAIVTGASSGIGRATSLAFAREGASLVLIARSRDRLSFLADEIRAANGRESLVMPADVCLMADTEKIGHRVMEQYGRIDFLVNSAGILSYKPFLETAPEELSRVMAVNYFGSVACIRSVLPLMIRQGFGHIVNISSTAGRRGFPMEAGYCASKFAITGFSEALRMELHGTGVGVSVLSPGIVDTPMAAGFLNLPGIREEVQPMPVDRIAIGILQLVINRRTEMILPWSTRLIIRINGMVPRLADWVIRRRVNRIGRLISRASR